MGRHFRGIAIAVLLVSVSIPVLAQRGADTAPRTLDVLVDRAEVIVRGHVVHATVEPHPQLKNLQTVVVQFSVDSVLKGSVGKTMTFRQYIWDIRDRYDTAGYAKGQELLLLLNPTSEYGLTSPTGMGRGRFRILRKTNAKAIAMNETQNLGLFQGTTDIAARRGIPLSPRLKTVLGHPSGGPMALDDLEAFVRTWSAGSARAK